MGRSLDGMLIRFNLSHLKLRLPRKTQQRLGNVTNVTNLTPASVMAKTGQEPRSKTPKRNEKEKKKKHPENQLNLRQQLANVHHRAQLG
jgi:hypothetical protein